MSSERTPDQILEEKHAGAEQVGITPSMTRDQANDLAKPLGV